MLTFDDVVHGTESLTRPCLVILDRQFFLLYSVRYLVLLIIPVFTFDVRHAIIVCTVRGLSVSAYC